MSEQLTPLDAAFLEIEQADECSHMHIGSVTNLILDPSPEPPSLREGDPAHRFPEPATHGRQDGPATLARGARAGIDFALHPISLPPRSDLLR